MSDTTLIKMTAYESLKEQMLSLGSAAGFPEEVDEIV